MHRQAVKVGISTNVFIIIIISINIVIITVIITIKYLLNLYIVYLHMDTTITKTSFHLAKLKNNDIWIVFPNIKGWFPLRTKQRLHWFRKSTITTTRTIFIFHLKTYWCSHRVIVEIITQNLLSWNQDGHRRVLYDVIFVLKLRKKKRSQNVKNEQRVWIMKSFEKHHFLFTYFDFFGQWFLLTQQGRGFLILFSWLSFSESISISILLNLK